jgi:hypothetical protein
MAPTDLCTALGANNAFEKCLINTLLNLGAAGLQALKQVLNAELLLIDAALVTLIAQLLAADVVAQQAQLIYNVIQAEEAQLVSILNGLPLGLLDPSCTSWAGLNGSINQFIQQTVLPPINQILQDILRILSLQSELAALKAAWEALKAFFLGIIDLLTQLILEAKCRQAASGGAAPVLAA